MNITCPFCGVPGSVDEALAGKKIRCPKCDQVFRCEREEATPPAFEQEVEESREEPEESGSEPVAKEVAESPIEDKRDHSASESPEFETGRLLSLAWQLTSGTKGSFWLGIVIMYLVLMALGVVAGLVGAGGVEGQVTIGEIIIEGVISAVSSIFTAGLIMMGIKRARYQEIHWRDVTSGFSRALQIVIAALLQTVLITIGFILLIVPGIYLMVGYALTFGLIIDRNLSAWEAMEMSRKTIHGVWLKFFVLLFFVLAITIISAIPFGIGLVWTIPFSFILMGVVYTRLFDGDSAFSEE